MISKLFIYCSGADKEILRECPTDRAKFIGIGATVFFTAVLASISGGYAIYFTFNSLPISLAFGALWGAIIFNLDRYIVASIKKTGVFKQEFITAIPRIIMAFILAITISKPLETKLFDGTIKKKLGETENKYIKEGEVGFNKQRDQLDVGKSALQDQMEMAKKRIYENDPVYNDLSGQKQKKDDNINTWTKQINNNLMVIKQNSRLITVVIDPVQGITRKEWRYNEIAKAKQRENKNLNEGINSEKKEISEINEGMQNRKDELTKQVKQIEDQYGLQISGITNQINDLNSRRPEIMKKFRDDAAGDKDILSRLRALSSIKSLGNTAWMASLFITCLFILLECAPITVKLLSRRGPYDEILDRKEYEIYLQQQKIISDLNDEVNNGLKTTVESNKWKNETQEKMEKIKLDKELNLSESILDEIAAKQAELAKVVINNWYEEELSKAQKKQGAI